MRVCKLRLKEEFIYPEAGGEIIRCPVCKAVWMVDDEHVDAPCPHLRFVFCTYDVPDFVFFSGDWSHEAFKKSFQKLLGSMDEPDEIAAFRELDPPEVGSVVYWTWDDHPFMQFTTYWGYKE